MTDRDTRELDRCDCNTKPEDLDRWIDGGNGFEGGWTCKVCGQFIPLGRITGTIEQKPAKHDYMAASMRRASEGRLAANNFMMAHPTTSEHDLAIEPNMDDYQLGRSGDWSEGGKDFKPDRERLDRYDVSELLDHIGKRFDRQTERIIGLERRFAKYMSDHP